MTPVKYPAQMALGVQWIAAFASVIPATLVVVAIAYALGMALVGRMEPVFVTLRVAGVVIFVKFPAAQESVLIVQDMVYAIVS